MCHNMTFVAPNKQLNMHLQHISQLAQQLPLMVIKGICGDSKLPLVRYVFDWGPVINNKVDQVETRVPPSRTVTISL